jgi:DNA-binding MarR family transcriptional regulator
VGVLAVLREADRAGFAYLRDELGLTDGNLSRHLRTLEDAGYIEVLKGSEGQRPRTWVSLTRAGARALEQELKLLPALVARIESTPSGRPAPR